MLDKTEYNSEVSLDDIKNICHEVAYSDPKAHKLFNKGKIKSKYLKIDKVVEKAKAAIAKGDEKGLQKIFEKNSRVLERYTKLNPKLGIRITDKGGYEITEGGNIGALRMMYGKAKENATKDIGFGKELSKKEKHDKEVADLADKIDERNKEKTIEENERKGREDFNNGMDRAYAMDDFRKELEGQRQEWNREAIEKYGDSDSGRAWSEMEKNPYKKQLDEINGDGQAR